MHGSHGGEARWGNVKNSAVDGTHRGTIRNLILAINFCLHFTPVWHKIAQLKRRLRPRDRFWRTSAYFWILTARSARTCAQTALQVFAFSCKRLVCCFCALPVSSGRLSCLEVVALGRGVKARASSSPDELLTRYVCKINWQRYLLILS